MTPDKLQELIVKHVSGWADQHDEDKVKKLVYKKLDEEFQRIMMLSLGLRYDWGEWKADERSESWKNLQVSMQEHVKDYFAQVTPPKLKPPVLAKANKEIQDHFDYEFVNQVRKTCVMPMDLVPKFIEDFTKEFSSKKLEDTIKLLKGKE